MGILRERLRNCHSPEEIEEAWPPDTMWYPELDSRTEKKGIGGEMVNPIEIWSLVNSNVLMMASQFWQIHPRDATKIVPK